ncbi:isopenicillin-N N-acyltransferase-like protein [Desulfohalotomaculum tongense]|uniref:C45 family autoproteolytic acyltransferase/hydolase n=1 Tax=Desulforadius tongensis TaxID=1216062 RepID=UPI0019580E33|nr:C45 family peptidase [Desulforadius tongensis]MBM7856087.1 isopenicillin-N N-acyltransferase-like protein [Desulforadius tongensis]
MKKAKAFKIIECKGTAYEIGRQYGEACKDNILKSLEMNLEGIIHRCSTSKEEIIANANKFLPLVKNFDPQLIEFLKGESEGAGISFEEAFYLRSSFEVGLFYGKISGLCTSFAITGAATKNGKTMLGQNIDWTPGFPMDLLKIRYANGLEQLALSLGGVLEYTLNSAGLGMCANMTLTPMENYQLNIPIGCYLPKVMRQKSISDALGILCQAARGIGYYHLANAGGNITGIESVFDDFNVLQPEKDILVHSNHYLTERFKKGDWGYFLFPDSYLRVNRIQKLIEQNYGNITLKLMMEILSDHNNYPHSICRHIDEEKPPEFHSETLASFIMVPEDRTMYISYGNPCHYEYLEYKL